MVLKEGTCNVDGIDLINSREWILTAYLSPLSRCAGVYKPVVNLTQVMRKGLMT